MTLSAMSAGERFSFVKGQAERLIPVASTRIHAAAGESRRTRVPCLFGP